jgi:hypothetical protein
VTVSVHSLPVDFPPALKALAISASIFRAIAAVLFSSGEYFSMASASHVHEPVHETTTDS